MYMRISTYMTYWCICLCIFPSVYLSAYLSTCLSTYLITYLLLELSRYLSTYLSTYVSTYLSIYPTVYPPIYPSIFLSITCLSTFAVHHCFPNVGLAVVVSIFWACPVLGSSLAVVEVGHSEGSELNRTADSMLCSTRTPVFKHSILDLNPKP